MSAEELLHALGPKGAVLRMVRRFGTVEQYEADAVRYAEERQRCLDQGLAEEHPLTRMWTRRRNTVQGIIRLLKEDHAGEGKAEG